MRLSSQIKLWSGRNKLTNNELEQISNQPTKCLSDKGLLYLKYGISKIPEELLDGKWSNISRQEFEEKCIEGYMDRIRGNPEFTNKSMRSVAAAYLYIMCVCWGINLTQMDIAEIYEMSVVTIRNNYREIKRAWKM